eukprot:921853_1
MNVVKLFHHVIIGARPYCLLNVVINRCNKQYFKYCKVTGYESEGCPFDSHEKVDLLMREIDYKINTSICTEMSSEIARQKHLKSHSEKKALAIVLKQEDFESFSDKDQNIKIKVGMKMCQDCHAFFCQVSKKYNEHNIQCVDPVGTHLFLNGVCQLCRSSV